MSPLDPQRIRSQLQRDKGWLNQLYCASNYLQSKRILNFAEDAKLETLIKYLNLLSNGVIKIKRQSFEAIEKKHYKLIKKYFESKVSAQNMLQSPREQKLKILIKLANAFPHLLYPLFNET